MGRWTPKYYDEVLVTKFENIFTGIVQRLKDEDDKGGKQKLSYEAFVQSLDESDSFTTTIIEILAKELADRQTRLDIEDRSSIMPTTVLSLKTIGSKHVIYYNPRRGSYGLPPYRSNLMGGTDSSDGQVVSWYANSTSRPSPYGSAEDDDPEGVYINESPFPLEGARIDSNNLYDAYRSEPNPSSRRMVTLIPHSARQSDGAGLNNNINWSPVPFPTNTAVPHMSAAGNLTNSRPNGSNTFRQPSTRRQRTRTADFGVFTARHRNMQRGTINNELVEQSSTTRFLRSPQQNTPPIIPPPPSAFSISSEPLNAPRPPRDPLDGRRGSSNPEIHVPPTIPNDDEGADHGVLPFYSSSLSRNLRRADTSFPSRHLPPLVPHPRTGVQGIDVPQQLPADEESSVLRPLLRTSHGTESDGVRAALDIDYFERDMGAWFDNSDADMIRESRDLTEDSLRTSRDNSEPVVNLPTPRSVSPRQI